MQRSKKSHIIIFITLVLMLICMLCGFSPASVERNEEDEKKQEFSTLVNMGTHKQEVTNLATTSISGCSWYVRTAVEQYYTDLGYPIAKNTNGSADVNGGEKGKAFTFKCNNDTDKYPEYKKIRVNYIGNTNTSRFGSCDDGQVCSAEIFSLISLQNESITGCNSYVRKAIEAYYDSKGVYVVKNNTNNDYNTLADGSKYSFKCENDTVAFPGYKQIMAEYIGTDATQTQGICPKGSTCHTIIWSNADLGIDDVSIDIDEGRLVVSGLMHDDKDAWNMTFDSIQEIIVGVTGIGVLMCTLAFVLQFIRLGSTAGNPAERERVLKGIIWTGVGAVGCGAVTLIFSFAFNIL